MTKTGRELRFGRYKFKCYLRYYVPETLPKIENPQWEKKIGSLASASISNQKNIFHGFDESREQNWLTDELTNWLTD